MTFSSWLAKLGVIRGVGGEGRGLRAKAVHEVLC